MAIPPALALSTAADGQTFTIPEVPGTPFTLTQLGGSGIQLVLTNRAMPYRPIEFGREQRVSTDWYQGSPEATQQVSGYTLPDSEWHGFWKDRYIMPGGYTGAAPASVNGTPLQSVAELILAVEVMVNEGQQIEVTWGRIVRRGIISKFVPKYHNMHDVEWSLTWSWGGENEPPPPPEVTSAPTLSGTAAIVLEESNLVSAAVDVPVTLFEFPTLRLFLDAQANIDGFISTSQALLNRLQSYALMVTQPFDSTVDYIGDTTHALRNLVRQAGIIVGTLEDTAANVAGVPEATLAEYGATVQYVRNQQEALRQSIYSLSGLELDLLLAQSPGVMQVYVAQSETDLRRVSQQFFGTADHWRTIALFNRLETSTVSPGQRILIPVSTTVSQ